MHDFLRQINNDDEALAVLAGFGFTVGDWSFMAKLSRPKEIISSDLILKFCLTKLAAVPYLSRALKLFRQKIDQFYQSGGFLLSPLSHPQSRLFRCNRAPLVFFGRYNRRLLDHAPKVAIVGARRASPGALVLTKNLAATLARNQINVVSGGADGVDQAAHLGALENSGTTILVSALVCGGEAEKRQQRMWEKYSEKLLLIHPFGPFTPQGKFMFIERNRYVALLSDRVVVVQGKSGSGTLHTARFAKKFKIPLRALPGAINDPLAFAPNKLLATREAEILVDFEHFAMSLITKVPRTIKQTATAENAQKNPELPYILQVISEHNNSLNFDEIMRLTGCPFTVLQKELLNYELAGRLAKRGAQFVLTGN